jgi:hypothetical protein
VYLFTRRVLRVLQDPESQPHAEPTSAREAQWRPALPADLHLPGVPVVDVSGRSYDTVLQGALVSLAGAAAVNDDVRRFAAANFPGVADDQAAGGRVLATTRIKEWAAQRRARWRAERARNQAAAPPLPAPVAVDDDGASLVQGDGADAPPGDEVLGGGDDVPLPEASDPGSLYYPPEDDGQFSAGYHSYGDTDSLGSAGHLVTGAPANWTSLDDQGWDTFADDLGVDGV